MRENIVLIGMRGSGKSHIGKELATRLKMQFFDTDRVLENQIGQSIPELVAAKGWDYFRAVEAGVCAELSKKRHAVIATGGGIVLQKENIDALKQNGVVVFLKVPLADLAVRLQKSSHKRPSLTGKNPVQELTEIWEQRKDLYENAADIAAENPNDTEDKGADIDKYTQLIMAQIRRLWAEEKETIGQ